MFIVFFKNLSGDMDSQLRWIHQLLTTEQQFVLCLQFGIGRYLLPLAERKDVLKSKEHGALFQNVQEVCTHLFHRADHIIMNCTCLEKNIKLIKCRIKNSIVIFLV